MKNGCTTYNEVVFTTLQRKDIVDSYLRGESSVVIGKRYGTSHKVITRVLREEHVEINQSRIMRKYTIDENYFDCIDTPNKAYILGLLYSDGSNNPNKSTISISLQEEDKTLLERIRKELKSEKPLEYLDYTKKHDYGYHYKNQYRLLFFSRHMSNTLTSLGVVKNKSLVIKFPSFIRKDLMSHFIRGVFDGDGSVCAQYKNPNNTAILVTITATKDFCIGLRDYVQSELGINCGIYDASCHNGVTKVLAVSGRCIAKKFLDWIYKDADIYLQRKYERYIDYYTDKSLAV